jgi:hypothetical protein
LNADTGSLLALPSVSSNAIKSIAFYAMNTPANARFCLNLLTLKPGMFTHQGKDAAGQVWFDDLGLSGLGLSQSGSNDSGRMEAQTTEPVSSEKLIGSAPPLGPSKYGAPGEGRTPKIWFLKPTRIPIPSPGLQTGAPCRD